MRRLNQLFSLKETWQTEPDTRIDRNSRERRRLRQQRWSSVKWQASLVLPCLALIALIAFCFWVWNSGRFDVARYKTLTSFENSVAGAGLSLESVTIKGDPTHTTSDEVRETIGANRGESILAVSPVELREQLIALPWVREAAVERHLPNHLVITLIEKKPLAIWQMDGAHQLLGVDGREISGVDLAPFANLPMLVGKNANQLGPSLLRQLKATPRIADNLYAAIRVRDRRWDLRLRDGTKILLPETKTREALIRVANLDKTESLFDRNVQVIDLRLPDRIIVRLGEKTTPEQLTPTSLNKSSQQNLLLDESLSLSPSNTTTNHKPVFEQPI